MYVYIYIYVIIYVLCMYIYIHTHGLATELAGYLEVAITQYNYHYVPGLKPKVSLQSSANISCLADLRTARPSSVISKSQPQARDTCGRPTALGNLSDRVAP